MRVKCLIWVSLSATLFPMVAVAQVHGKRETTVTTVSTHRSDSAIFAAVTQTQRVQRKRRVKVSGSTQALSNRSTMLPAEEAAQGGTFIAPASFLETQTAQALLPNIYIGFGNVTDHKKPSQTPKKNAASLASY